MSRLPKPSKWPSLVLAVLLIAASLGVALGGGGWLLATQLADVAEGVRSYAWPQTTATVVHAEAVRKYSPTPTRLGGGQGTHVVELRYDFTVDGRAYSGTRRHLDDEGKVLTQETAQIALKPYPVGRTLPVHYDPADPTRALLLPGVPIGGLLWSAVAAGFIGLGCIPLVMLVRRRLALRRWRNLR